MRKLLVVALLAVGCVGGGNGRVCDELGDGGDLDDVWVEYQGLRLYVTGGTVLGGARYYAHALHDSLIQMHEDAVQLTRIDLDLRAARSALELLLPDLEDPIDETSVAQHWPAVRDAMEMLYDHCHGQ